MKLPYARPENLRTPPRGLLTMLMRVSTVKGPIGVNDVSQFDPSESGPRVFLHYAEKAGLLIRGEQGKYYPVDMRVVLLSSMTTDYFRSLWRVHDVLERSGVPHAFACLTTSAVADYLPSRPIVAVSQEDFPSFSKADFFGLVIDTEELTRHTTEVTFEWEDGTPAFGVRELDRYWTSLLLGAIGLPREIAAARRLLEGMRDIDEDMVRRLNSYGLSPRKDVLEKEEAVLVPSHIDAMRAQYAEALRQIEVRGGEVAGK
jgi:hypothetical protein